MIIDDQIKDGKLQYDIDSEAAKISALSSAKIDKYEYLKVKKYYLLIKNNRTSWIYLFSFGESFWKAKTI